MARIIDGGKGDWMLMEEAGAKVVVLCTRSSSVRVGDNLVVMGGIRD